VVNNFPDHRGLGDEGDDAKLSTGGTEERAGVVEPANQIIPTFSEGGSLFGGEFGLTNSFAGTVYGSRF